MNQQESQPSPPPSAEEVTLDHNDASEQQHQQSSVFSDEQHRSGEKDNNNNNNNNNNNHHDHAVKNPPSPVHNSFRHRWTHTKGQTTTTTTTDHRKTRFHLLLLLALLVVLVMVVVVIVVVVGDDNDGGDVKPQQDDSFLFENPSHVQWKLQGQIITDPMGIDNLTSVMASPVFAWTVALDGDWLAIGTSGRGVVLLYRWNGEQMSWIQHTVIEQSAQDAAAYQDLDILSRWGSILAMAKGRIAISSGPKLGKVQTWDYDAASDQWKLHKQPILEFQQDDDTGGTVDLNADGTVMAIGSDRYGVLVPLDATGLIRIFQRNQVSWQPRGRVTGFRSGDSVGNNPMRLSPDGNTLIAGSAFQNTNNGIASGIAWVWRRSSSDSTDWKVLGQPLWGPTSNNLFGTEVAANGNVVSVYAPGFNGTGAVFVYEYVKTTSNPGTDPSQERTGVWKQRGHAIPTDRFYGAQLCLTGQGNVLAVLTALKRIIVYQYQDEKWVTVGSMEEQSRQEFFIPENTGYIIFSRLVCSLDGRTIALGRLSRNEIGAVAVWRAVDQKR